MMGLTPQKTITTILTKECNKKLSAYLLTGVTKSCTELYKHSVHSATVMFHGGTGQPHALCCPPAGRRSPPPACASCRSPGGWRSPRRGAPGTTPRRPASPRRRTWGKRKSKGHSSQNRCSSHSFDGEIKSSQKKKTERQIKKIHNNATVSIQKPSYGYADLKSI